MTGHSMTARSTTRLQRTPALLLATALALASLAACGSDGTEVTAGSGDDERPGERRLVLRMETVGGFLPPGAAFREVPLVSVYSDGLVITQGPQIEIYPPPALASLVETQLDDGELEDLLADARDSGVFEIEDFGEPPVADAGTTVFTLRIDGEARAAHVYALGFDDAPGLTPAEQEARRGAAALQERLGQLSGRAGEAMWEPERVAVLVTGQAAPSETARGARARTADSGKRKTTTTATGEGAGTTADARSDDPVSTVVDDSGVARDPVDPDLRDDADWPGPALATFGEEGEGWSGRCGVLAGAEAGAVLEAAAQATTATRWQSEGVAWDAAVRPLLPDESTCQDVVSFPKDS